MYIAGLVIAIIGIVVGLVPLLGWVAVPMNIAAVIIGIVGINKKETIEKQNTTRLLLLLF